MVYFSASDLGHQKAIAELRNQIAAHHVTTDTIHPSRQHSVGHYLDSCSEAIAALPPKALVRTAVFT
jgi:hypothetical protein